jgi:hypothetical protein
MIQLSRAEQRVQLSPLVRVACVGSGSCGWSAGSRCPWTEERLGRQARPERDLETKQPNSCPSNPQGRTARELMPNKKKRNVSTAGSLQTWLRVHAKAGPVDVLNAKRAVSMGNLRCSLLHCDSRSKEKQALSSIDKVHSDLFL